MMEYFYLASRGSPAHPPAMTGLQAVETEVADLLVVSVAGELPISREVEELLKSVKTSVYIFR
jgi:hypothetical protein